MKERFENDAEVSTLVHRIVDLLETSIPPSSRLSFSSLPVHSLQNKRKHGKKSAEEEERIAPAATEASSSTETSRVDAEAAGEAGKKHQKKKCNLQ